jgi:putative exporter of polyketide antibiotics
MEKRTSLFYFVLFFLVAIASFGDGTHEIIDFIGIDKSISLLTETGVPFLGAVAFIVGYFVNMFGLNPKKTLWAAATAIIWATLLIVFIILGNLNRDYPIHHLFRSIGSYSIAGMGLAWSSDHLRKILKP